MFIYLLIIERLFHLRYRNVKRNHIIFLIDLGATAQAKKKKNLTFSALPEAFAHPTAAVRVVY